MRANGSYMTVVLRLQEQIIRSEGQDAMANTSNISFYYYGDVSFKVRGGYSLMDFIVHLISISWSTPGGLMVHPNGKHFRGFGMVPNGCSFCAI